MDAEIEDEIGALAPPEGWEVRYGMASRGRLETEEGGGLVLREGYYTLRSSIPAVKRWSEVVGKSVKRSVPTRWVVLRMLLVKHIVIENSEFLQQ